MKKIALLAAAGLILTAVSAQAGDDQTRGQEVRHAMANAADTNNDGALSKAEFVAYGQKHFESEFARLDKNSDGVLTPDERPTKDGIKRSLNKRVANPDSPVTDTPPAE